MKDIPLNSLRQLFTVSADGTRCEFTEQLDRKVYARIADALTRIEGRWSKKENAFVFPFDVTADIEEIFTTGNLPKRNPLQLHPTPRNQVLDMIDASDSLKNKLETAEQRLADTGKPLRMLEPSIGLCGIADVVRELYPTVEIIGVELDDINVRLARQKGYDVTHNDFLQYPIPQCEEDRFDVILMNPPFMGRDFIKHIRHAQAMLRVNGNLVSVTPFNWMAGASAKADVMFLDEISRTSSMLTEPYPAGTYEKTDCVTCIVELMHEEMYRKHVTANKDHWLHVCTIELENDLEFRTRYDRASQELKQRMLLAELTKKRNVEGHPSVVEWADEVMVLLHDDEVMGGPLKAAPVKEMPVQAQVVQMPVPSVELPQVSCESLTVEPPAQPASAVEVEQIVQSFAPRDAFSMAAAARVPKMLKPFVMHSQR